jgi:hypothetical protein
MDFVGLFPLGKRRFRLIASNPLSENSTVPGPDLPELQKLYDMRSTVPDRFGDLNLSS